MEKSILITGASSGIGKALAFEFARRGYALALTARRLAELEKIKDEIQEKYPSPTVEIRLLDVMDYESVPGVLKEAAHALNGLNIVIANAGIGMGGKIGRSPFENARRTIETNLIGAMATVDAAVGYFLEKGSGHVVGISSVVGFRGMPGNSSYCASKAGLSNYLGALRAEVLRKNIDVTIIRPGYIDTPLNDMIPNRPFLVPVERGAALMARAIEKKAKSATIPVIPWKFIGFMLKVLPTSLLSRMT
ncbi:SDR family oxidoreductase [Thermodesulfobacteriota bacterium]